MSGFRWEMALIKRGKLRPVNRKLRGPSRCRIHTQKTEKTAPVNRADLSVNEGERGRGNAVNERRKKIRNQKMRRKLRENRSISKGRTRHSRMREMEMEMEMESVRESSRV